MKMQKLYLRHGYGLSSQELVIIYRSLKLTLKSPTRTYLGLLPIQVIMKRGYLDLYMSLARLKELRCFVMSKGL